MTQRPFTRAHRPPARPPPARAGVAESHLRAGPDNASALLDFLEKTGAGQLYPLAPLENLGIALQKAGRHEEALAVFARVQQELPKTHEIKAFSYLVRKLEKALGRRHTTLPKMKFSFRALFRPAARPRIIVGTFAALVVLCLVISNEFIRRYRTVHLVNSHAQAATVEIAGTDIKQQFRHHDSIVLPEGDYHAIISGPVTEEFDFQVRASYFSRWSDDPAWVINVGGDAVLISSFVTLRKDPPPASIQVHFGKSFEHFSTVTHPFTALPDTVQLKDGQSRLLVKLQTYNGPPQSLFGYLVGESQHARAFQFAEHRLRGNPSVPELLRPYLATSAEHQASAQAEAFIRPYLHLRPPLIEWHRAYQDLRNRPPIHAALVAEYDALLAAEPADSGLLYLRGRLAESGTATRDFFERSIQADARNPFSLNGLGYDRMAAGEWAAARDLLARAAEIEPQNLGHENPLILARLALGEGAAVESETRARLNREPASTLLNLRLIDALASQNRPGDALEASRAYLKLASKQNEAYRNAQVLHRHALYATGDFAALERASSGKDSREEKLSLAHSLIEQGRLAEAARTLPIPDSADGGQLAEGLALSVAWRRSGDATQADRWLARACGVLAQGNEESIQASRWLEEGAYPSLASAQDLVLDPQLKALVLLAATSRHRETLAGLAPLIRQLNVERSFPYHLVNRSLP